MKQRIVTGVIGLVALVGVLAACGDDDDMGGMDMGDEKSSETTAGESETTAGEASADFNDADVAFAQGMIPHHQQAVEMAELAEDRAERPEVTALAERIKAAQDPEIEQMQGWVEDWGQEESGGGMDHGDDMGMMSQDDLAELEAASGPEFDELFMTMMIEHHEGAITQAETELEDGQYEEAKDLAQAIIDAQEAEIEEMQGLLDA